MRREIHNPKPEPPDANTSAIECCSLHSYKLLTSALKFVSSELRELTEHFRLVFLGDSNS